MPTYRAAWIVPVAKPPIPGGWVSTRNGRVVAIGTEFDAPDDWAIVDLGPVAIMPALVNVHTHLELSWLRGRIAPATGFVAWVGAMMRERLMSADANNEALHRAAMLEALTEMHRFGTGVVGDVSNSLMGLDLFAEQRLSAVVFQELLGFNLVDPKAMVVTERRRAAKLTLPPRCQVTVAPHAPYSVSAGLFEAIRDWRGNTTPTPPTAVHVAEGADELEFLQIGGGPWRALLQGMGTWDPDWTAPGCGPIEYLDRLRFWGPRTIAVHAVRATSADLECLRARGATVATCPRSNQFVGAGAPPVSAFYASGVPVAVGTDSLSSVEDLNLFAEIAELHRLAPEVEPARLLSSASLQGAQALGLAHDYGSIEAGKAAALVGIRVPSGLRDVEDYLVNGISADQIQWLESGEPC